MYKTHPDQTNPQEEPVKMEGIKIDIRVLPHCRDLPLPAYASDGAAGMDLRAAIDKPFDLAPGERTAIPTGLQIAVPSGYEAQIRPRSGWALKRGITVANAPGTIDSDYRGEVLVALINLDREPQRIHRGDRIAQMVIAPVVQANWHLVEGLEETQRGTGGFGSTGLHQPSTTRESPS